MRVQRPLDSGEARNQVLEHSRDLARVRHAGRVGERDRARAHVDERFDHGLEPCERHVTFERAPERRRDAAVHRHMRPLGDLHDPAQLREGLGDRHVDVREVVALARRDDGVDGVDAGVDGTGRAFVVGDERGIAGARPALHAPEHRVRGRHLWNRLRTHEGAGFDGFLKVLVGGGDDPVSCG